MISKSFLWGHFTSIYARLQCHVIYANFSCPISKALSLSKSSYHFIISFIVSLLNSCCPFYISRKITFRVINSFKSKSFTRTFWYFFQKSRKIKPRLIYFYSPAAIVCVSRAAFPCASLNDVVMRSVNFCSSRFCFISMFKINKHLLATIMMSISGVNPFGGF